MRLATLSTPLGQRAAVQATSRLSGAEVDRMLEPGFSGAEWAAKWRRWREAA